MKKKLSIILFLLSASVILLSCSALKNPARMKKFVYFKTTRGEFVVGLYEGTPNHRNNFIKNCKDSLYDSTLVYSAKPWTLLKIGLKDGEKEEVVLSKNYIAKTIAPEINSKLYPKNGALGMLQYEKGSGQKSDTKLFFIVEGFKYDEDMSDKLLMFKRAEQTKKYLEDSILTKSEYQYLKDSLNKLKQTNIELYQVLFADLMDSARHIMKRKRVPEFTIPADKMAEYQKYGGSPENEGKYTIFGEIVWNRSIVEKIATKDLTIGYRPRKDVWFLQTSVMNKSQYKKFLKSK